MDRGIYQGRHREIWNLIPQIVRERGYWRTLKCALQYPLPSAFVLTVPVAFFDHGEIQVAEMSVEVGPTAPISAVVYAHKSMSPIVPFEQFFVSCARTRTSTGSDFIPLTRR